MPRENIAPLSSDIVMREHLARRVRRLTVLSYVSFGFGVPLSLLGPCFLSAAFWFVGLFVLDTACSYFHVFAVVSLLSLPLLYQLEWRTRGQYRADFSNAISPPTGRAVMPGMAGSLVVVGTSLANTRATASVVTEILLFGPKLVLGALQTWKTTARFGAAEQDRAAMILEELLSRDKAMKIERLVGHDENMINIMRPIAFLLFYKWISVSHDWDRIWLYSESRRILAS